MGTRMSISNKFPGKAGAAGSGTYFENQCSNYISEVIGTGISAAAGLFIHVLINCSQ
jgi:hypothetical protein